jgi:hypothetical protein
MEKKMMRFLISVEAEVTDPVAVLASGVSSVVDTEGNPVDPYVPSGEYGLLAEIAQQTQLAVGETLQRMDGVKFRSTFVLPWKAADDGSYPPLTLPAMPASQG